MSSFRINTSKDNTILNLISSSSSTENNSVLYTSDQEVSLTTSSPNTVIVFDASQNNVIILPNITSNNDGLTFSIRYYGSYVDVFTIQSNSSNIYRGSGTSNVSSFNNVSSIKLIAYNGNWYNIE